MSIFSGRNFPEKTAEEKHQLQAAKLLMWLLEKCRQAEPRWLQKATWEPNKRSVSCLKSLLKELGKIPESKDREAKELALWWHDEKAKIRQKETESRRKRRKTQLCRQALAKLTLAEKRALNLVD